MTQVTVTAVLRLLKKNGSAKNRAGMQRFGIQGKKMYGVPVPAIRKMSRQIGKDHALALKLWRSGVHEARILASIIAEPEKVTKKQIDAWAKDFDSWDIVDQCCGNLFDKTAHAYPQALRWSTRREEFIKRAGFSLMAYLAVHDKAAEDTKFLPFLRAVIRQSTDDRNFVRKAVNWALRQIGKRNSRLRQLSLHAAAMLKSSQNTTARWIGSDAYRELASR